jgi:tRNA 2-selenouridine synthase
LAITKIEISECLLLGKGMPLLDVRSPSEYAQAHIPGAISFPLFTDEERRVIGTAYKQESRRKAIREGLGPFGRNLVRMVEEAERLIPGQDVVVHCWRGGMRSAAVAWLLDLYGFQVYLLKGGYKAYRRWAGQQFTKPYPLRVIGGYTGSNKTGLLHGLKQAGEQVIDLEGLAGHRGSAFGNLARVPQPSQEQFENDLALALYECSIQDENKVIWIEQETQRIGQINVPPAFYRLFSVLPSYFIEVPFEERLKHIVGGYGTFSKESLINAIIRVTKKLGGLEAKTAVTALMDDDIPAAFAVLLRYYDRLYHKHEAKRKAERREEARILCSGTDVAVNLKLLLHYERRR